MSQAKFSAFEHLLDRSVAVILIAISALIAGATVFAGA